MVSTSKDEEFPRVFCDVLGKVVPVMGMGGRVWSF
jgi:hypothetical protein